MNWSSIKEAVAKFAPLAGTLLGGPAGPAIGALISSALGSENTPEAVMAALGNPDNLLKLKQMEADKENHLLSMQLEDIKATNAYNLEKLKVETGDTQNARTEHKQSIMPAVVTVMMTIICAGLLYAILKFELADGNKELAFTLFGTCFALWGQCVNYWVGTTRSSAEKTSLLRR